MAFKGGFRPGKNLLRVPNTNRCQKNGCQNVIATFDGRFMALDPRSNNNRYLVQRYALITARPKCRVRLALRGRTGECLLRVIIKGSLTVRSASHKTPS
jgi:hypothetical protein